jgi:hypothetical protein
MKKMFQKSQEMFQKSQEMFQTSREMPQNKKSIQIQYSCDYCQFTCDTKKEAEKHRKSKQHVKNENKEEDFLEITQTYMCTVCEKTYDKYASCWKHTKTCKGENNSASLRFRPTLGNEVEKSKGKKENTVMEIAEIPPVTQLVVTPVLNEENIKKDIMESIVEKMMDNNKHMMEQMVTVVKTILQEMKPSVTQNNTNNNSNNNNHYTINMFLNEKCKDAINITDWAKQLHINYDHLYYTGENGFQKGLTNMLVENLKLCDVYNRPIHFTDIKRDSMYIREDDEWTKHENSEKLTEVLEISARQACIRLTDWMKEHENVPDYHDLDSELGQQYLALMVSVIRPQVERSKAFPKVIKELAKTAQLRKEDQV